MAEGYDPDALNDASENAEEPDNEATIEEIEETTAGNVYPESVDLDDPTKPMIRVIAETGDGTPVTEAFSLPQNDAAWHNPTFKLGQFKERYGSVPSEGMTVNVEMNEEGLLSIVY